MIHLLIVFLDDSKLMPALLHSWEEIGVPGATILASAGSYRSRTWLSRLGLGAIDDLFRDTETRRHTLMVAVETDELLEKAIAEAEQVVGGFDRPGSGLLLVLPIGEVRGLHKVQPRPQRKRLPPAVRAQWIVHRDTPIEVVNSTLNLRPTIIHADATLDEVARAMLTHPRTHVVCVVDDQERLVGLIDLGALAEDLFFHIMPEEFLSEITDLEHAIHFAEMSGMRTAADAMHEPIWVKNGETVKDAFERMHKHHLQGLPVIDDLYRVTGYINLLELAAVSLEQKKGSLEVTA
jgi:CBS domain-containing protein